jgi:hypothetical protein
MWDTDKFETKHKFNGLQCAFGMSRTFFEAADKELGLGNNAFLEIFIPSVAKKHGLTASHTAFPVFQREGTEASWRETSVNPDWVVIKGVHADKYQFRTTFEYTQGDAQAPAFYNEWKKDGTFCPLATILHPVKV